MVWLYFLDVSSNFDTKASLGAAHKRRPGQGEGVIQLGRFADKGSSLDAGVRTFW